jgi:hypothetical protein
MPNDSPCKKRTQRSGSYAKLSEHTQAFGFSGETLRGITKAAIGSLAGFALVLGGTQVASGSDVLRWLFEDQGLTDMVPVPGLDPADIAFDRATASLRIMDTPEGTGLKLRVEGIDTSVEGRVFGSHLHVGPCLPGADTTGGHYQNIEGGPTTADNEVWFEVIPNANGVATHDAFVSFDPVDRIGNGDMSIVIHALTTNPETGKAGTKETCLPLEVGDIW